MEFTDPAYTIVIAQIEKILTDNGENLGDYTIEGTTWEIKVTKGSTTVTINFICYDLCFVLVPDPKWLCILEKKLCKFLS